MWNYNYRPWLLLVLAGWRMHRCGRLGRTRKRVLIQWMTARRGGRLRLGLCFHHITARAFPYPLLRLIIGLVEWSCWPGPCLAPVATIYCWQGGAAVLFNSLRLYRLFVMRMSSSCYSPQLNSTQIFVFKTENFSKSRSDIQVHLFTVLINTIILFKLDNGQGYRVDMQ